MAEGVEYPTTGEEDESATEGATQDSALSGLEAARARLAKESIGKDTQGK